MRELTLRSRRSQRALGLVALALAGMLASGCAGCRGPSAPPRIVFVGDSLTQGYNMRNRLDEQGGFPGRLQRRLGARATILNRGLGGFSTHQWVVSSDEADWSPFWHLLRVVHPAANLPPDPPPDRKVLVEALLAESHPDVTVILLGANDMQDSINGGLPIRSKALEERFVANLHEIERIAQGLSETVLVGTILPSLRDPDDVRKRLNRRIREEFDDVLPLGEEFERIPWRDLLSDKVHLSPAGYDRLAALIEAELEKRDLLPPPSAGGDTPADGRETAPLPSPAATASPTPGA